MVRVGGAFREERQHPSSVRYGIRALSRRGISANLKRSATIGPLADDLASGRLVALFEEEADPDLGYYMVYRPAPHRQPLAALWSTGR